MRVASNIEFGLKTPIPRPAQLVRSYREALIPLVDYATDRMSIAQNILPCDAAPLLCRHRLCRFFGDLSAEACARQLGRVIDELLSESEPWEYEKIGLWMDGRWSCRRSPMLALLWRLHMTDQIVAAAAWLHDRGNGIILHDDDTRSDRRRLCV
jgi:hypothetical protein